MPTSSDRVLAYRWGAWELCLQRQVLRRAAVEQPLPRRLFEVLRVLVEHRDRVLRREELAALAWPDGPVDVATVTRTVARCRARLMQAGDGSLGIRVRRGVGYQFADGPVTVVTRAVAGRITVDVPSADSPRPMTWVVQSVSAGVHESTTDFAQALATFEQGFVRALRRVSVSPVVAPDELKRRLGAAAGKGTAVPAPVIWAQIGPAVLLSATLGRVQKGWRATLTLTGPCGGFGPDLAVTSTRLEPLSERLVQAWMASLSRTVLAGVPMVLPDAFAAEALARAGAAARAWRWVRAQRLASVVLDLVPDTVAARVLVLRALVAQRAPDALAWGESLLLRGKDRLAPGTLAAVHLELARIHAWPGEATARGRADAHLDRAAALCAALAPTEDTCRVRLTCARRLAGGDAAQRARGREALRALAQPSPAGPARTGDTTLVAARVHHALAEARDGNLGAALDALTRTHGEFRERGMSLRAAWAQLSRAEVLRDMGRLPEAARDVDDALASCADWPDEDLARLRAHAAAMRLLIALDRGDRPQARLAAESVAGLHDRSDVAMLHADWMQVAHGFAQEVPRSIEDALDRACVEAAAQGHAMQAARLAAAACECAMAVGDPARLVESLARIAGPDRHLVLPEVEAVLARGQAWLACRVADRHRAVRTLDAVARDAREARSIYLARLEQAWWLVQLGALDRARHLLAASAAWSETAAGHLVGMALALAYGRPARARACLSAARLVWAGDWPASWSDPDATLHALGCESPTHHVLRRGLSTAMAVSPRLAAGSAGVASPGFEGGVAVS